MTITEDWTLVNAKYSEPRPVAVNQRRQIMYAVFACAREHDGKVHPSWVRPLLDLGALDEGMIGNVMSHLAKAKVLVRTGDYLPSGDAANRNNTRDIPVRRVADWSQLSQLIMAAK